MRERILTIKLEPESEQWRRLRELAWQAAAYRNVLMRGCWSRAVGLAVDADKSDAANIDILVRHRHKGELSGSAYSAAEREVRGAWQREGKRVLAGAPMPQWRQADALAIRGHKNRMESGVRLDKSGDRYLARLQVQAASCEGGSWMTVPVAGGTEIDSYQAPLLDAMCTGDTPILKGVVCFRVSKGRTLLRLAYRDETPIAPAGERVATLGPVTRDGRLWLRAEGGQHQQEYTGRLVALRHRKEHWDGIRRRLSREIGKGKGRRRMKRTHYADGTIEFSDWCSTHLHTWSRDVITWCIAQGVGSLVVVDLAGGDWPAHKFEQYLKYKAQDAGIEIREASLEDASTERAAKAEARRKQRKAKQVGDAVRNLTHALTET